MSNKLTQGLLIFLGAIIAGVILREIILFFLKNLVENEAPSLMPVVEHLPELLGVLGLAALAGLILSFLEEHGLIRKRRN